jgi:glycosyltransferase involved in cell wall biosynthesis
VLGSVVIPAYNEATVIGRCLDALFEGVEADQLDVVVVCNGCTDGTAAAARATGHPIRVIELSEGSKPAALRAGDGAVALFPRLYLDADVALDGAAALALLSRLRDGAIAARPPARFDTAAASAPVRAYYRVRARLPTVTSALWGAGVYGLSEQGRARFDEFPDLVGDDLWVDRQFGRDEIEVIECAPVRIRTPRRSSDLVSTLRRTYRGKRDSPPGQQSVKTAPAMLRDLRALLRAEPGAAVDVLAYCGFAFAGRIALATGPHRASRWERDDSSRA